MVASFLEDAKDSLEQRRAQEREKEPKVDLFEAQATLKQQPQLLEQAAALQAQLDQANQREAEVRRRGRPLQPSSTLSV